MAKLPSTASVEALDRVIEKYLVIPEGEAVSIGNGVAATSAAISLEMSAVAQSSPIKKAKRVGKPNPASKRKQRRLVIAD